MVLRAGGNDDTWIQHSIFVQMHDQMELEDMEPFFWDDLVKVETSVNGEDYTLHWVSASKVLWFYAFGCVNKTVR